MSGRDRGTFRALREWSVGPSGRPKVVWWPSQMSESGQEALPDFRQW